MGKEAAGITGMEIAYSFGLAAGILLFFNHFGSKRITGDLTPIEVSMRKYEEDADRAMIEMAGRRGEEK